MLLGFRYCLTVFGMTLCDLVQKEELRAIYFQNAAKLRGSTVGPIPTHHHGISESAQMQKYRNFLKLYPPWVAMLILSKIAFFDVVR